MSDFYNKFWIDQQTHEMADFPYKWPVISKLIPKTPNLTILDYGTGSGIVMAEMKKINPKSKYIGMDVSKSGLKMAKKRHKTSKFYEVKDGGRLPLKDKSVDFILAADVIEHAFYTEKLLSELSRVLKPGGKILLSTPYHGLIKNLIIVIVGFEKVFNPTEAHIRFFTKKSLFPMMEKVNLKIEKYGYFGRFYPISNGIYVLATKINSKSL